MQINWFWIIAGFIPYSLKRKQMKDECLLTVKALFWRLTIHQSKEQCSWDVFIPFIEHLRRWQKMHGYRHYHFHGKNGISSYTVPNGCPRKEYLPYPV